MKIYEEQSIHASWKTFFGDKEVHTIIQTIESSITGIVTPSKERILRFASIDLEEVNCVIWGRDPYPQLKASGESVATGRSFEVSGTSSWNDKSINASLRNILKLLHKSYFQLEYSESIEKVRKDIESGIFPVLPPNEAFNHWEEQGALFLNRAFTCSAGTHKGASGSHESLWIPFFEKMLPFMVEVNPTMKHFLWGKAKELAPILLKLGVEESNLYVSKHPSAFTGDKGGYEKQGNFLNNACFHETMNDMKWINK